MGHKEDQVLAHIDRRKRAEERQWQEVQSQKAIKRQVLLQELARLTELIAASLDKADWSHAELTTVRLPKKWWQRARFTHVAYLPFTEGTGPYDDKVMYLRSDGKVFIRLTYSSLEDDDGSITYQMKDPLLFNNNDLEALLDIMKKSNCLR